MKAGSARAVAVQVVARVVTEQITLDAALERESGALPPAWRAAVRSLSYGAIRGFYRYEFILARLLSQPLESIGGTPQALLSVALFELEDARSPDYAIVDAAVKSARLLGLPKLAGLINAVLRRYLRERTPIAAEVARNPVVRHAFPEWLAMRLRSDWPVRWTQMLAASDRQAPMWLRINPRRVSDTDYLEQLRAAGKHARMTPRLAHAIEMDEPCDVRDLPGFEQGLVSVQDLGAQCAYIPLALEPGQRVLDACAAPGGKTGLIAERQPDLAALVALDVDAERLQRVHDNLQRCGLHAQLITADAAAAPGWWNQLHFERILLDVPCSALGVIRRHPDIRIRRNEHDFESFARTQSALLHSTWKLLAPGGRLVYATCTLTRRENRDILAAFLLAVPDAHIVPVKDWAGWPELGEEDGLGVQIIPGEAGADGFYYAALTKQ